MAHSFTTIVGIGLFYRQFRDHSYVGNNIFTYAFMRVTRANIELKNFLFYHL